MGLCLELNTDQICFPGQIGLDLSHVIHTVRHGHCDMPRDHFTHMTLKQPSITHPTRPIHYNG